MGSAAATFSSRLLKPHPTHLQASLIFSIPGEKKCSPFFHPCPPTSSKGFHLFRKVWQEREHLHTFVCQEKKITRIEDIFIYPEEIPEDKKLIELSFYVSKYLSVSPLVNGEKATLFHLGDCIEIAPGCAFCLKLFEGSGDFVGRISQGNRPSQILPPSIAYDWRISIRTLRRSPRLKMQLLLGA